MGKGIESNQYPFELEQFLLFIFSFFQFLQRLTENDARRVAVHVEQREDATRCVAQDLFDLAEDRSNAGPCCKRDEVARCRGLCFEDETTRWSHAADCIAARQCAIRPSAEDAIFNLFDGQEMI